MNADPAPVIPFDQGARPCLAAGARLQTDRLSGLPVLLFPEGMLKLNSTGAAILELCDGHRSAAEVLASLAEKFNVSADVLRADVAEYLGRLVKRGLIRMQPHEASDAAARAPSGGGSQE